jgi:hypothetical protein
MLCGRVIPAVGQWSTAMSDASSGGTIPPENNNSSSSPPPGGQGGAAHAPFPAVRLFYSIGYGLIAWFVIHIVFLLAVVQFVVIAINGRNNEELKNFCLTLVQYLWELLAFITFVRDEQPFPMGPFPKHA